MIKYINLALSIFNLAVEIKRAKKDAEIKNSISSVKSDVSKLMAKVNH
ncbi:hypothetical protein [Macrococcus capreoli]